MGKQDGKVKNEVDIVVMIALFGSRWLSFWTIIFIKNKFIDLNWKKQFNDPFSVMTVNKSCCVGIFFYAYFCMLNLVLQLFLLSPNCLFYYKLYPTFFLGVCFASSIDLSLSFFLIFPSFNSLCVSLIPKFIYNFFSILVFNLLFS